MQRAIAVLEEAIERGAMPGAVVCIAQGDTTVLRRAIGTVDGTTPTTLDTLYDLASITKPLATAATVLSLVEEGRLLLGQSIAELIPGADTHAEIRVRHLLTHTSGLPAWTACYDNGTGLDAAVAAILALPTVAPETQYTYSCLGYILLAKIVEVVTGKSLDIAAQERIFTPNRLRSLTFHPKPELCAPTIAQEGSDVGVVLRGTVHDGNARGIMAEKKSVSGNAGLFGDAHDVVGFGQALLSGALFGKGTRQRFLTTQSTPPGHTLGFFANPNPLTPSGELLPETAVGHSGFTGTVLTLVPEYDLVVCLLSNPVFQQSDKADFLLYRRKFFNVVAGAL